MPRDAMQWIEVLWVPGVGKLVQINNVAMGTRRDAQHKIAAYESGAAGHQNAIPQENPFKSPALGILENAECSVIIACFH